MFDDPEMGVKILEKNAAAHERLALEYGIDIRPSQGGLPSQAETAACPFSTRESV